MHSANPSGSKFPSYEKMDNGDRPIVKVNSRGFTRLAIRWVKSYGMIKVEPEVVTSCNA
jgi:hypothetical protein